MWLLKTLENPVFMYGNGCISYPPCRFLRKFTFEGAAVSGGRLLEIYTAPPLRQKSTKSTVILQSTKFFTAQSIFILLIPVLGHGLAVMAVLTQCLPVGFIPEQLLIPTMRHDMIYHRCLHQPALFLAPDTQRMCFQEPAPCPAPPAVIPAPGRRCPVTAMQCFMFLTIYPVRQFRASLMLTWFLRLSRHGITTSSLRRNIYPRLLPVGIPAGSAISPLHFLMILPVPSSSYGTHRILHSNVFQERRSTHSHISQNNPSQSPFHPFCFKKGSGERIKPAALTEAKKKPYGFFHRAPYSSSHSKNIISSNKLSINHYCTFTKPW